MALTAKKKLDPDRLVVCTQDFATAERLVKRGDKLRASDPITADHRFFVDADLPECEWPSMWDSMPAPPSHGNPVTVQEIAIPPHRQLKSRLDVVQPAGWAKDSPGSESARAGAVLPLLPASRPDSRCPRPTRESEPGRLRVALAKSLPRTSNVLRRRKAMASKPRIHDLKPQPTIAKSIAASKAHVQNVNAAASQKGKGSDGQGNK